MRFALGLFIASTLAVLGLAAPSVASGTGDPVITSPAHGATVPSGWTGPVNVDMSDAPIDTYEVAIQCNSDSSYRLLVDFSYDGSQDDYQFTAPYPIAGPDQCTVSVANDDASSYQVSVVHIAQPPLAVGRLKFSASSFYPIVRDGFKDSVVASYEISRAADVTVAIRNSAGRTIRTEDLAWQDQGRNEWVWDGAATSGKKRPGHYTLRVTARDGSAVATAETGVDVRTKVVELRHTLTKNGLQARFQTRDSCEITRYDGADLNCFYGGFARATYNFSISAHAHDLKWRVRGEVGQSDVCCHGRITKRLERARPILARVVVQVTGAREYLVRSVVLSYATEHRM